MEFGRRRPDAASSSAGDSFASEALALMDALYGTALRLTRQADRAQDLVQDTYLKAFRARSRFAAGTNLKAWLYTILHNTWRNARRDQARSRVEFDSDAVEQAGHNPLEGASPESPETLLLRSSVDAELQSALDALPETFRAAVWLRDVEELSYQEIADVLAIPMGTVMSRISRGRRQLYERLQDVRNHPLSPGPRSAVTTATDSGGRPTAQPWTVDETKG
jgi:RNA polymerase sigma-70 factor, ECF subfamily